MRDPDQYLDDLEDDIDREFEMAAAVGEAPDLDGRMQQYLDEACAESEGCDLYGSIS